MSGREAGRVRRSSIFVRGDDAGVLESTRKDLLGQGGVARVNRVVEDGLLGLGLLLGPEGVHCIRGQRRGREYFIFVLVFAQLLLLGAKFGTAQGPWIDRWGLDGTLRVATAGQGFVAEGVGECIGLNSKSAKRLARP